MTQSQITTRCADTAAMDSGKIVAHISDYRQRVLQDKQN